MKKRKGAPIARGAYTELAEVYAAKIDTKAHNAFYERPATLSLLPDVKGRRVLDAGCGPGAYAEELLERGASVVCVDVTEKMLEQARKRVGTRAEFYLADLSRPLPFLKDAEFDLVLSPLVLDYVEDWRVPFGEFFRMLKPGGVLVFSMEHPASSFRRQIRESYFNVELQRLVWRGFGPHVEVPSYRRSLQDALNPLLEVGFILERLIEPQPVPEFKERDEKGYDELMKQPGFLCVRAKKTK